MAAVVHPHRHRVLARVQQVADIERILGVAACVFARRLPVDEDLGRVVDRAEAQHADGVRLPFQEGKRPDEPGNPFVDPITFGVQVPAAGHRHNLPVPPVPAGLRVLRTGMVLRLQLGQKTPEAVQVNRLSHVASPDRPRENCMPGHSQNCQPTSPASESGNAWARIARQSVRNQVASMAETSGPEAMSAHRVTCS